jgi:peptidase A4-like protein
VNAERVGLLAALAALLALAVASPLVAGATHVTAEETPSLSSHSVPTSAAALGVRWAPRPPAGFDPVSATSSARALYGFPPPPAGGSTAAWRSALSAAVVEVMPALRVRTGAAQESSGWSGVVDQPGGVPFGSVAGGFNNPLLTIPDALTRRSSIWVGLGGATKGPNGADGTSGGNPVAAGTEEDQDGSGPQLDYAWWQSGAHAVLLDGFPAGPAQTMFVWIASAGGRLDFFIEDVAARTYAAFSVAGSCACGSAEWVDSAATPPLALFNYVVFADAYATRGLLTEPANGAVRSIAGETTVDLSPPLTIRRVG